MFGLFNRNKQTEEEVIQIVLGADRGDPDALVALNSLYKAAKMTDSKKHALRRKGYAPLADAGDVDAQIKMGLIAVVDEESEVAESWFLKAADQGSTEAMLQLSLGYAVYNACSFGEDLEKSFQWLLKAAELGSVDAQCQVATEYFTGENVTQDYESAFQWYQKAAAQNFPEAHLYLAEIYATDEEWNTHFDPKEGRSALIQVMESRDPLLCAKAAPLLAEYYAKGALEKEENTFSEKSAQATLYWLCQSFWFGNRSALPLLRKLCEMTGLEVSEEESKEWRYHYRSPEDDDN